MNFSALRRNLLVGSLGLALSAGLLGQAVAGEQLQKIKDAGVINVGLEGTYPPFSFVDADGKLTGFEVEFSEALAKELGVKVKLQPTKWDGILAALESKRLDAVINQVTISEERKKKYDFSEPYTVSGIQALTLTKNKDTIKTAADLAGKKVGVGLGTNYEQWVKENVPKADIRTYEDDPTKFQDLRVGRIDAILIDRLAALGIRQEGQGHCRRRRSVLPPGSRCRPAQRRARAAGRGEQSHRQAACRRYAEKAFGKILQR
jgi:ABC-type amino acid transport/signal transduction systems, periplasmic component/domain